ncbi:DUF6093 family protein [Arthrobacter sp. NPDC056886]|uniref:DUF6093 family protein n=1 Tax=Arthrobacter sp. NPDC056886 TaxID=3345960 RepID=UPI00366F2832
MGAIDATLRGRAAAESLMIDACKVQRPGEPTTDPDTGEVTPSETFVYSGPCKVQQTISQASSPTAGEHAFTVQDSRVDFPVSAGPLNVDDVVTITVSVLDPQLVGSEYRVVELFHKSMATAQRTRVQQVTE